MSWTPTSFGDDLWVRDYTPNLTDRNWLRHLTSNGYSDVFDSKVDGPAPTLFNWGDARIVTLRKNPTTLVFIALDEHGRSIAIADGYSLEQAEIVAWVERCRENGEDVSSVTGMTTGEACPDCGGVFGLKLVSSGDAAGYLMCRTCLWWEHGRLFAGRWHAMRHSWPAGSMGTAFENDFGEGCTVTVTIGSMTVFEGRGETAEDAEREAYEAYLSTIGDEP